MKLQFIRVRLIIRIEFERLFNGERLSFQIPLLNRWFINSPKTPRELIFLRKVTRKYHNLFFKLDFNIFTRISYPLLVMSVKIVSLS